MKGLVGVFEGEGRSFNIRFSGKAVVCGIDRRWIG